MNSVRRTCKAPQAALTDRAADSFSWLGERSELLLARLMDNRKLCELVRAKVTVKPMHSLILRLGMVIDALLPHPRPQSWVGPE